MQLARAVAGEAKWLEQRLLFAEQFPGHQRAHADHLVAVVGVSDHVRVLAEGIEDGEAVRGESPDAPGGFLAVEVALLLESLEAVGEARGPHPGEVFAYDELGAGMAGWLCGDLS